MFHARIHTMNLVKLIDFSQFYLYTNKKPVEIQQGMITFISSLLTLFRVYISYLHLFPSFLLYSVPVLSTYQYPWPFLRFLVHVTLFLVFMLHYTLFLNFQNYLILSSH
jgi:hypothetical protein